MKEEIIEVFKRFAKEKYSLGSNFFEVEADKLLSLFESEKRKYALVMCTVTMDRVNVYRGISEQLEYRDYLPQELTDKELNNG